MQYYEGSTSTSICAGLEMDLTIFWIQLTVGSVEVIVILIGFIFDILMIFLLRNLRKTQPIQLVPWKSVGKQEANIEKISIPVRATLISFSLMSFTFFVVIVYIKYLHFENFIWLFCIAVLLTKMIIFPCVLVFTIKQSKNVKPKPTIPNRPIFHDCELDNGENNYNVFCGLKNILSTITYDDPILANKQLIHYFFYNIGIIIFIPIFRSY